VEDGTEVGAADGFCDGDALGLRVGNIVDPGDGLMIRTFGLILSYFVDRI